MKPRCDRCEVFFSVTGYPKLSSESYGSNCGALKVIDFRRVSTTDGNGEDIFGESGGERLGHIIDVTLYAGIENDGYMVYTRR